MAINLNLAGEPEKCAGHVTSAVNNDLDRQRLRILRCTAQAMTRSPGGLRFKPGSRPWLEGISCTRPDGPSAEAVSRPAVN